MDVNSLPNIVIINGEPYSLAKQGSLSLWQDVSLPAEEGDNTKPMRVIFSDWSRGMGDSHGLVRGAVERAVNLYTGHIGRIFPGPSVSTITTALNAPVAALCEVTQPARRLIALGGRYAAEIDGSHAVTLTQDFGAGKNVTDAVEYRGQLAIAMGDGVRFWSRSTAGVYAENTNTSDSAGDYRYADCFGRTSDGYLARGRGPYWSKCIADNFASASGAWSAENQVGLKNRKILDVLDFQRWDYVLKEDGLYAFDDETGDMVNELPDMAAYPATEASWFAWYNRLLLCQTAGLYRYVQAGGARTVGIEENRLNLTFAKDCYPTAGIAYGAWAYVAYYSPGSNTTLLVMFRLAQEGDAAFSSFTPVCAVDEFTGKCKAMLISDISGSPRIYYGRNTAVGHFALSRNGLPGSYRAGAGYLQWVVPSEAPLTTKFLRSIGVDCDGQHSGSSVQIAFSWDGANWTNLGAAVTANGVTERFATPGSGDSGKTLWVRLTVTNANASAPVTVSDVVVNIEERPAYVRGAVCALRMRDYLIEGGTASRKTAQEQLQHLQEAITSGFCTVTDPYGKTWRAAIRQIEGQNVLAGKWEQQAQPTIAVSLREVKYE